MKKRAQPKPCPDSTCLSRLLDLAEAVDQADVEPGIILERAVRRRRSVGWIEMVHRAEPCRRNPQRQVGIEVVIEVGSDAHRRANGRLPDVQVLRRDSLAAAVELANGHAALAGQGNGEL